MKLKEYEVQYIYDGNLYTLPVWTATETAARESALCYVKENLGPLPVYIRRVVKR